MLGRKNQLQYTSNFFVNTLKCASCNILKLMIFFYRFITHDTIEERIKNLQDMKMQMSNAILTGSKSKGSALSIDDLKSLFDM